MVRIDAKELSKVPYLRAHAAGDRSLRLAPFWDGAAWHLWIAVPDGTLFPMKPQGFSEGSYVATEPAVADDIYFPFMEFVWKRASWPEVDRRQDAIVEDVHQLAASIAKIDFFWRMREHVPGGGLAVGRYVRSELEFLLTTYRTSCGQSGPVSACSTKNSNVAKVS